MSMNAKGYYKKSFEIIKDNKKIICFFIIMEILFLIGGSVYYWTTYHQENISYEEQRDMAIASAYAQDHFFANFLGVFPHNAISTLYRIITGVAFAYTPIDGQAHDAVFLSYAIVSSVKDKGMSWAIINWLHAFMEVPAFILASSLGTSAFLSLFKPGNRINNLTRAYKNALLVFIWIILPVLFIAGIIEALLMTVGLFYFTNEFFKPFL